MAKFEGTWEDGAKRPARKEAKTELHSQRRGGGGGRPRRPEHAGFDTNISLFSGQVDEICI